MSDPYDEVPYDAGPQAAMHPRHLAAVAWLHGLDVPDPRTSRILEIGAGPAGHLVHVASQLPEAQLVAIDRSAVAVAQGQARVRAVGLDNLEVRQGDVCDLADLGTFDYILSHGLYSWVDDAAREGLMAVCARALAPNGLACVSYNCLPGWDLRAPARRMALRHARRTGDLSGSAAVARNVLATLARASTGQEAPLARIWSILAEQLQGLPDAWIIHDLLSHHNRAFEFLEVVAHAEQHGLAWLAEAEFPTSRMDTFDPRGSAAVRGLSQDLLEQEQDMDYLYGRTLRSSIWVRREADASPIRDPSRIAALTLGTPAEIDGELVDIYAKEEQVWRLPNGRTFRSRMPEVKAMMAELRAAWPAGRTVAELCIAAAERLGKQVAPEVLAPNLLAIFDLDGLWAAHHWPLGRAADVHPRVFGSARTLMAAGEKNAVNGLLSWVPLDGMLHALGPLVDGRSQQDLMVALADALRRGQVPVRTQEGADVADEAQRIAMAPELTRQLLGRLAAMGLLQA